MCTETRFLICKHCGNIVGLIHNAGVKIQCCGQAMEELIPNTTEASQEKHLPVAEIKNNLVKVQIGSQPHPMTEEHHIEWVYLQSTQGGQRKCLASQGKPEVVFALTENDKAEAIYAYCNLHGLWKTEL
ncbi:MAG: desulfoferrodoxin family protein [Clostridiales bacterium]